MGWYGEHIFPHLMEWVMGGEEFQKQRSLVLARVNGTVLEIGFGTGLNLPHYPAALSSLHAIDPAHMLPRKIAERSAAIPFPLQIQRTSAETLPYNARSFNFVVSTWTLSPFPIRSRHSEKSIESSSLTEYFCF